MITSYSLDTDSQCTKSLFSEVQLNDCFIVIPWNWALRSKLNHKWFIRNFEIYNFECSNHFLECCTAITMFLDLKFWQRSIMQMVLWFSRKQLPFVLSYSFEKKSASFHSSKLLELSSWIFYLNINWIFNQIWVESKRYKMSVRFLFEVCSSLKITYFSYLPKFVGSS